MHCDAARKPPALQLCNCVAGDASLGIIAVSCGASSRAVRKALPPTRDLADCALHWRIHRPHAVLGLPRHKCRHRCQQYCLRVLASTIALGAERTRVAEEAAAARSLNSSAAPTRTKQAMIFVIMDKGTSCTGVKLAQIGCSLPRSKHHQKQGEIEPTSQHS